MKFLLIIVLSGLFFLQCSSDDASSNPEYLSLVLIDEIEIPINEPSGLSLGKNQQSLWVVSDAPDNEIFEISLTGDILRKLNFKGDDLEGIAFDSSKNVLWVVEEKLREIIEITTDGTELSRYSINIDNTDNNGLEGISTDPDGNIWVVNEKNPGALLSLKDDYSIRILYFLDIAKDYSGISFDDQDNRIWIVSDESRLLLQYDANTNAIKQYNLSYEKAEGIAVNTRNKLVYIVNETNNRLFIYEY